MSRLPITNSKKAFEARLPSGITVELLGVSENPSKDKPWWRPDGSPLEERPYDWGGVSVVSGKDEIAREFAVRLHNLPSEPVGTAWGSDPSCDSSSSSGNSNNLGKNLVDIRSIAMRMPATRQTLTIRFGVADGPWQTLAEASGNTTMGLPEGKSALFSIIDDKSGDVVVSVAHNFTDSALRVIVIGKDNREYYAHSEHAGKTSNVSQITATFSNISLKDIKVFRLQNRDYKWVEFRNVSLQPGQKTDVQIVWPDADKGPDDREKIIGIGALLDFVSGHELLKRLGVSEREDGRSYKYTFQKNGFLVSITGLILIRNPKR